MAALVNSRIRSQKIFISIFRTSIAKASTQSKLAKLRSKTGFAIKNCKKALDANNQDYEQALQWLADQAQKEGWAKATKLQGRAAAHGLIGLTVDKYSATAVEVSCETDFVARNDKFQSLVSAAVESCKSASQRTGVEGCLKETWSGDVLQSLPWQGQQGRSLADCVALCIGKVGENIVLRQGVSMHVPEASHLAYYIHSAAAVQAAGGGGTSACLLGRYAAVVALDPAPGGLNGDPNHTSPAEIGRRLCQHIVGMKPAALGSWDEFLAFQQEQLHRVGEAGVDDGLGAEPGAEVADDDEVARRRAAGVEVAEAETRMLFQPYLIDEDQRVGDVALDHGLRILDFFRLECGEHAAGNG